MYFTMLLAWLVLICAAPLHAADGQVGPWDVTALKNTVPEMRWVDRDGPVHSLLYAGEPYQGHATEVFAFYASPATIGKTTTAHKKFPGVVLIHGGGGTAFAEWAMLWAQRGYAAIAMDLSGRRPDTHARLPNGGPEQGHADKFDSIGGETADDWPFHAVASVIRAHSLLRSIDEVDADRTAVTGISWGGYTTCLVASLDDRFKAAVPVYGCGFLFEGESVQKPSIDRLGDRRQQWIDTYDPAWLLPRCRVPILFVNGSNDPHYPLDSYQQSFDCVGGPKQMRIEVNMPHGHPAGWAPEEIGLFIDSLCNGGQPLPVPGTPVVAGDTIRMPVESVTKLTGAALHFTSDAGLRSKRAWTTVSAQIDDGVVIASRPPAAAATWFVTVTDERNAMVSSTVQFPIPASDDPLRSKSLGVLRDPDAPARRPNVIFILTDDQGWGDGRFAGHPYAKTPHLDRLAREGTWFRQFYVAATVCSPSRAAFMTSHYPARHQIHGHFATDESNAARSMPNWLDPSVTTLPDLLKTVGYATAHFGKWHLGGGRAAPPPAEYGFDESKTVNSSGPSLGDESKTPFFRAESTRLIVDETIDFIRRHKDSPFYANVWTLLPHAPLRPTPEQLAVYADLEPRADDPTFGPWMQKYLANAEDLRSQMRVFCASLTDLDTQIGRLLDALDELGIADDTIILLSSDNGPEDYRIRNAANAGVGSTGPLRGRKRSMYEGGIRTFGLVRWPGKVPAGKVDETSVVGAVDFLPTIARLAGATLPEGLAADGEDLSGLWCGTSAVRKKPLHWEWLFGVQGPEDGSMPPALAIRDGDWKLFVNHDGTGAELYRIPTDPGESHDLAAEYPDIVKAMTEKALAWARSLPPSAARDTVAAGGVVKKRVPR
jgi:arylsulfatase A-like enzyme/dienelactone hydrolase